MESAIVWLDNRRAMRLAYFAGGTLISLLIAGYLLLAPIIQPPVLAVSAGGALIAAQGLYLILHAQPIRVGLTDTAIVVRWFFRRKEIPLDTILLAAFTVNPKYLSMDWSRRFYSAEFRRVDGRRTKVGGLDGPVAQRLMEAFPESKREVMVRRRSLLDTA